MHSHASLDTTPPQYLIPPVEYVINTTECLCDSMKDLASDIHYEHDCTTTEACDGVRCELNIQATPHIMEICILSCEQPPAVDILIENEVGHPFLALYISDNATFFTLLDGTLLIVHPMIIHHPYYLEFQVYILQYLV